jgi:hypothetical protein
MQTIRKFRLGVEDRVELSLPVGAQVLCVQTQDGVPCLWVLVDPDETPEMRAFRIYATGQPIDGYPGEYVGTVQSLEGQFVFHVFAETDS